MQTTRVNALAVALLITAAGCSDPPPPVGVDAELRRAQEQVLEERQAAAEKRHAAARERTDAIRAAAERGDPAAQNELGGVLAFGELLPQDYVEAYQWLALAAAAGEQTARARQEAVASELGPEELAEAERRVRSWRPVPAD